MALEKILLRPVMVRIWFSSKKKNQKTKNTIWGNVDPTNQYLIHSFKHGIKMKNFDTIT